MVYLAPDGAQALALPRVVFVLGKGGVGRSSVAAALGVRAAARGEQVLVVQWAVADAIGPWFGAPPVGPTPVRVAPSLFVCNYALDEALRAYFVDHLHLPRVYRHVLRSSAVSRMLDVAPGIAELLFLGQLWWLTTLAEREAGWHFDRIIVDAPATGHGTSLLDVPYTLASMGPTQLLAVETRRVTDMMEDPTRTGAVVVTLPEPLVVDETWELIARLSKRLARAPLALLVNRSVAALASPEEEPAWMAALSARLSPLAQSTARALHGELRAHRDIEMALRQVGAGKVLAGIVSLAEWPGEAPIDVVHAMTRSLGEL